jgi:WD40 repeat protein
VAFTPDGKTLAVGQDPAARLWDVADPSQPRELTPLPAGHTAMVTGVAFSPNGKILITASADHTARLWDVANPSQPRRLAILTGHADDVTAVAFSPDGRTVATTGTLNDKTGRIRLWDVAALDHPRQVATLEGHGHTVAGVVFSPDGKTLATASTDRTARLWDVADPTRPRPLGEPLYASDNPGEYLYGVAFSRGGNLLAAGGVHGKTWLWDTNPAHLSQAICNDVGPLSREEWTREIPDVPYRPSCP